MSDAFRYRSRAQECALLARSAIDEQDQAHLLRMRDSWLALAENDDWLNGRVVPASRYESHLTPEYQQDGGRAPEDARDDGKGQHKGPRLVASQRPWIS